MLKYLLVVKHPNNPIPEEYECEDERDMREMFCIYSDGDDEVEFYDPFRQIFPKWAQ